jgi:hypothetical protein
VPSVDRKTIKVRCSSWEQVEAFYSEKLQKSSLVMKLPVTATLGEEIAVALELPSGLVVSIVGAVVKVGKADAKERYPVALEVRAVLADLRTRLARLVAEGRAAASIAPAAAPAEHLASPDRRGRPDNPDEPPPPTPDDAPIDEPVDAVPEPTVDDVTDEEKHLYQALEAEYRGLLERATHDVLGVSQDASRSEVRAGYAAVSRKYHPDAYGHTRSPALRRLAVEAFIHVNKAYDRLRAAAKVGAKGPAKGWMSGTLADFDDYQATDAEEIGEEVPAGPFDGYGEALAEEVGDEPDLSEAGGAGVVRMDADLPDAPSEAAQGEAVPEAPLTAESLFGDIELAAEMSGPVVSVAADPCTEGKRALEEGRWEDAKSLFATALRQEPRNRSLRALYHVASGMELRAHGRAAEATLQFETALVHDQECHEAQRAMVRADDKKGFIKRIFDR